MKKLDERFVLKSTVDKIRSLVRKGEYTDRWKVLNWKSVNTMAFMRSNPEIVVTGSQ
jgi:hypothetical protein